MDSRLLTPDGLSASSVQALASLTGCHRNRIPEYRRAGAPAGLDLGAWIEWHTAQHHTLLADRLRQALASGAVIVQAPAAEGAPAARAGAEPAAAQAGAPGEGTDAAGLTYAERKERAQALRAERELEILGRQYIKLDEAQAAVRRCGALVLEALAPGLWGDLLPALDGATPDLRKRLRTAHDGAVLRLRDRIAHAARQSAGGLTHGT